MLLGQPMWLTMRNSKCTFVSGNNLSKAKMSGCMWVEEDAYTGTGIMGVEVSQQSGTRAAWLCPLLGDLQGDSNEFVA